MPELGWIIAGIALVGLVVLGVLLRRQTAQAIAERLKWERRAKDDISSARANAQAAAKMAEERAREALEDAERRRTEMEAMARNLKQTVLIEYTRSFNAPITQGEVMGKMIYYPADGGSPVEYELLASRSIARRLNAPKTLEEIEAEVYADPNPFPPFSWELLFVALSPFAGLFIVIRLLLRLFRRTGRHRKGRVPKPGNRYFR